MDMDFMDLYREKKTRGVFEEQQKKELKKDALPEQVTAHSAVGRKQREKQYDLGFSPVALAYSGRMKTNTIIKGTGETDKIQINEIHPIEARHLKKRDFERKQRKLKYQESTEDYKDKQTGKEQE